MFQLLILLTWWQVWKMRNGAIFKAEKAGPAKASRLALVDLNDMRFAQGIFCQEESQITGQEKSWIRPPLG